MNLSDEEILKRVQQGDRSSYVQIFDRYYQRVERYACRKMMNAETAADLASETFLRAFRSVDSFRIGQISYLAFLYIICRRLISTELSKRSSAQFLPFDGSLEETYPEFAQSDTALDSVLSSERVCMLQFALGCLGEEDREIIHLAYEKDLSRTDIAEIMGKPSVTAVTSHLHRAMTKLKVVVHDQGYFSMSNTVEEQDHALRG